jgi:hypothetical protein
MKISIGQKNHEKMAAISGSVSDVAWRIESWRMKAAASGVAASSVSRRPSRFAVRASLRVSRGGSGMVASSVAMKRRNGVAAGAKKKKKKMAWRRHGKIIAARA